MRLKRFLWLGADPERGEGMSEPDLDNLDLDEGSPDPVTESAPSNEESPADKRAKELEQKYESEREARIRAEERAARPAPAPIAAGPDAEFEREEKAIRDLQASGATQDQLEWARWKISQDRSNRETRRYADEARNEARNMSDKASFSRLEVTNPKLYKRYAARVEETYQNATRSGQSVNREVILRLMIGDDIITGKVKPKATRTEAPTPAKTVDRGRGPSMVRSDVQSRQSRNDSEARKARLSKINI